MSTITMSPRQEREFNDLVRRSHKKVYNLAYRLSMNRQDAEDLTQEAFFRAYRSFSSYEGDKPFENWIMRIVTRLFLDLKRSRSRRVQATSLDAPRGSELGNEAMQFEVADPTSQTDLNLMDSTFSEEIERALEQLKPEQRELVLMADIEEIPYNTIAEISGVPLGTIRSRLHRAHRRLRELLVVNNDKDCVRRKSPCSKFCACALTS